MKLEITSLPYYDFKEARVELNAKSRVYIEREENEHGEDGVSFVATFGSYKLGYVPDPRSLKDWKGNTEQMMKDVAYLRGKAPQKLRCRVYEMGQNYLTLEVLGKAPEEEQV